MMSSMTNLRTLPTKSPTWASRRLAAAKARWRMTWFAPQ